MDLIIRKKLHVVMHKCNTVQFLFRQHGSLGALKMHDLKMTDKENYGSGKCKSGKRRTNTTGSGKCRTGK